MCCLLTWMSSNLHRIIFWWIMVVKNRVAKSAPDLKTTVFECSCIKCCSSSLKDDLEKESHNIRKPRLFFGLLGGFLIATTGHRKGVIINMTVKEVKTAEKTTRGCRVIRVSTNIKMKQVNTTCIYCLTT